MFPLVPPAVFDEVATPALAYMHPEARGIAKAVETGLVTVVELTPGETTLAEGRLGETGLGRGELQVLAIASERKLPALIFEHRGRNVARVLGARLVDLVELIFAGTASDMLLRERLRTFAGLVNLRIADYEALVERIDKRDL